MKKVLGLLLIMILSFSIGGFAEEQEVEHYIFLEELGYLSQIGEIKSDGLSLSVNTNAIKITDESGKVVEHFIASESEVWQFDEYWMKGNNGDVVTLKVFESNGRLVDEITEEGYTNTLYVSDVDLRISFQDGNTYKLFSKQQGQTEQVQMYRFLIKGLGLRIITK